MWLPSLLSVFLIGCACADLLPDRCPDWSSDNGRYRGYCNTEAKGLITKSVLQLPDIELPPNTKELKFVIPDKCLEWGRELAGSVVQACDYDTTPVLKLGDDGTAGPATVRRRGKLQATANVYMKQYCV